MAQNYSLTSGDRTRSKGPKYQQAKLRLDVQEDHFNFEGC